MKFTLFVPADKLAAVRLLLQRELPSKAWHVFPGDEPGTSEVDVVDCSHELFAACIAIVLPGQSLGDAQIKFQDKGGAA